MVQIVGKYQTVATDNLKEYFTALHGPEVAENATRFFSEGSSMREISQSDDKWTITISNGDKQSSSTFVLGVPFQENKPDGTVFESLSTFEDKTLTTVLNLHDGNQSVRTYTFTDEGIDVHYSDRTTGVVATQKYRRL